MDVALLQHWGFREPGEWGDQNNQEARSQAWWEDGQGQGAGELI